METEELLRRASREAEADPTRESDARWALVRALHLRGEEAVFGAAAGWCGASSGLLRCLGADVLGQLGVGAARPFAEASAPILVGLLGDFDEAVVGCALIALGHLEVGDTEVVCGLAGHPSGGVRRAAAVCLGTRDEDQARASLVALSADPDVEVRSWATFGLGSLSEVDSPAIREALVARLSDPDHEVRGEAMCGLAARGDARALEAILGELEGELVSVLAIEAAAMLPDGRTLEALESLAAARPGDEGIALALERCRQARSSG